MRRLLLMLRKESLALRRLTGCSERSAGQRRDLRVAAEKRRRTSGRGIDPDAEAARAQRSMRRVGAEERSCRRRMRAARVMRARVRVEEGRAGLGVRLA